MSPSKSPAHIGLVALVTYYLTVLGLIRGPVRSVERLAVIESPVAGAIQHVDAVTDDGGVRYLVHGTSEHGPALFDHESDALIEHGLRCASHLPAAEAMLRYYERDRRKRADYTPREDAHVNALAAYLNCLHGAVSLGADLAAAREAEAEARQIPAECGICETDLIRAQEDEGSSLTSCPECGWRFFAETVDEYLDGSTGWTWQKDGAQ